jgi:hypothetical protein
VLVRLLPPLLRLAVVLLSHQLLVTLLDLVF